MSIFQKNTPLVDAVKTRWFEIEHCPGFVIEVASIDDPAYKKAYEAGGGDPNRLQNMATRAALRASLSSGKESGTPGFRDRKRKTKAEQEADRLRQQKRLAQAIDDTVSAESMGLGVDVEKHRKAIAHLVKAWACEVDGERRPVVDESGDEVPCTPENVLSELLTDPPVAIYIGKYTEVDGTQFVNTYAGQRFSVANAQMIVSMANEVAACAVEDVESLGKLSAGGPTTTSESRPSSMSTNGSDSTES